MKVHEIMTAHARCVAPDNTLIEAAGLMRELDVGVLPVCEGDRIAGMVTDRDIVLRGVADGRDAYSTPVRDVMSQGVFHVFADQEVEEAARIMEEKQVRRLPVLNREKRLVGILSLGDMAVSSNPAFSGEALREVSESPDDHMHGGLSDSVARSRGTGGRMESGPAGTRRIPTGRRSPGSRGRKSDTAGERRASSRGRSGAGGKRAAGRGSRGARRKSAGTGTMAAKGGRRGAGGQGSRGSKRRPGNGRRRPAAARSAR